MGFDRRAALRRSITVLGGTSMASGAPSAMAAVAPHSGDARTPVGDGVADDGPLIQAAIDAADAAGGGRVELPAGTFSTAQPIFKPRKVELVGAGPIATTIKADWRNFPLTMPLRYRTAFDDPSASTWNIRSAVLYTEGGAPNQGGMHGFTIDGSRVDFLDPAKRNAAYGPTGYYLLGTANQFVDNVTAQYCEVGFHFDSTQNWRCTGLRARECGVGLLVTNSARVGRFISLDCRKSQYRDVHFTNDASFPGSAWPQASVVYPNQLTFIGGVFEAHHVVPDERDSVVLADGPETRTAAYNVRQCVFVNCIFVGAATHNTTNKMRALFEARAGARNFTFISCMFNPNKAYGAFGDGVRCIVGDFKTRVDLVGCTLKGAATAPHAFQEIRWNGTTWGLSDDNAARVRIVGTLSYEGDPPRSLGPIAHDFVVERLAPGRGTNAFNVAALGDHEAPVAVTATDANTDETLGVVVVDKNAAGGLTVLDVWDSRGDERGGRRSLEWRFGGARVPGGPDGTADFFKILASGQKNRPAVRFRNFFGVPRPTHDFVMGEVHLDNAGSSATHAPVAMATLPAGAMNVRVELHVSAWNDGGAAAEFRVGDGTTVDRHLNEADFTLGAEKVVTFRVPDLSAEYTLTATVKAARAHFDWRIRYERARGQFVDTAGTTLNAQTGPAYTLSPADLGRTVMMNNATAGTLTIPPGHAVAFKTGARVMIANVGSGQTTIQAAVGVSLNGIPGGSATLPAQGAVTLLKVGADAWFAAINGLDAVR